MVPYSFTKWDNTIYNASTMTNSTCVDWDVTSMYQSAKLERLMEMKIQVDWGKSDNKLYTASADSNFYNYTVSSPISNHSDYMEWLTWASGISTPRRPQTPRERLKEMIQARQAPTIIGCRKAIQEAPNAKERRARETLRRFIGQKKYRQFQKSGFITIRGKSGLVYQIFPGHGMTRVYKDGEHIEKLCVVLTGRFPPTDSIIMRFLLILNSEEEFRRLAVVWSPSKPYQATPLVDQRALPEIYRELVRNAA